MINVVWTHEGLAYGVQNTIFLQPAFNYKDWYAPIECWVIISQLPYRMNFITATMVPCAISGVVRFICRIRLVIWNLRCYFLCFGLKQAFDVYSSDYWNPGIHQSWAWDTTYRFVILSCSVSGWRPLGLGVEGYHLGYIAFNGNRVENHTADDQCQGGWWLLTYHMLKSFKLNQPHLSLIPC